MKKDRPKKENSDTRIAVTDDYRKFIDDLKSRVVSARISAARAITHEAILLYWDIGQGIVEKQKVLAWGESVVDKVAADLRDAFPQMTGFSSRNVRDMKRLYLAYSDAAEWRQVVAKFTKSKTMPAIWPQVAAKTTTLSIWPQVVAKFEEGDTTAFLRQVVAGIPWGHHRLILDKLTDLTARLWYLLATAQMGWSSSVLLNQIKAGAFERAVKEKKAHNFDVALPEHFVEQAEEMLKSTYNLEFLGLRQAVRERELEDRLTTRLQAFLLELGYGFCFVGRQHRMTLGNKEYFIYLLFYHRFLKCLVAFDLKVGPFEPEHAGKMDFYLNLLNDKERGPDDQPSIGIILCAEKDDVEVEMADRDANDNPFLMKEIDPFTFFGVFNRSIKNEGRIAILTRLKEFFSCKSDVPSDFDGIPLVNNMKSWFVGFSYRRKPEDVNRLWNVFRLAQGPDPIRDPEFAKAYDAAMEVFNVSNNLTMGLFWISPDLFISMEAKNREYLKLPANVARTANSYLAALAKVKSAHTESFAQISHNAHLQSIGDPSGPGPVPTVPTDQTYWFVGAYWKSRDPSDQSSRFLMDGIWQNGYPDKYLDQFKSMQVGDRIAIKSAHTQKNNLPFDAKGNTVSKMSIRAVGTITGNCGDGRTVEVDWDEEWAPKDWYFFTYQATNWKLKLDESYQYEEYAERLIRFAFNNIPQDVNWFLSWTVGSGPN